MRHVSQSSTLSDSEYDERDKADRHATVVPVVVSILRTERKDFSNERDTLKAPLRHLFSNSNWNAVRQVFYVLHRACRLGVERKKKEKELHHDLNCRRCRVYPLLGLDPFITAVTPQNPNVSLRLAPIGNLNQVVVGLVTWNHGKFLARRRVRLCWLVLLLLPTSPRQLLQYTPNRRSHPEVT